MGDELPETLTHQDVQRHFQGGPDITKAVLALIGSRIYKREGETWRLLDDGPPNYRRADQP